MSRKKRQKRSLKSSIPYFIVEGCTEENYLKVLKSMFRKNVEIHNCNGGSAKKVMEVALKTIEKNLEYTKFIVWFDNDTFDKNENNLLKKLSKTAEVVQSYPCIESVLFSHFEKLENNQLLNECKKFEEKLKRYIKNYKKNNCNQLKEYIESENIELSKKNYPKYSNNIEFIFNEFEKKRLNRIDYAK